MSTFAQFRLSSARLLALVLLTATLMVGAMSSVLATESHGEAPGLEPRDANSTENEFRPPDYEYNFLWGAAIGLGVLIIGGAGALGGMYWLFVQRPAQQAEAQKQG